MIERTMKLQIRTLVVAATLTVLWGCAGIATAAEDTATEDAALEQGVGDAGAVVAADPATIPTVVVGTLPPQELAAGQCGLFLWTNSSEPRLVFVSLSGGDARMVVNGEDLALARNAAEGQEYLGQFESQNFYSPEMNVGLSIEVERRPNIVDGAVIPNATLRVRESNGWETVIPVGGLIGCGEA